MVARNGSLHLLAAAVEHYMLCSTAAISFFEHKILSQNQFLLLTSYV